MAMEPEALTKGTEVWGLRVQNGVGRIFDQPQILHGVVTGGGSAQVIIQWDGWPTVDRGSRRRTAAGHVYATKREALVNAVKMLERIGADSYERSRIANSAAATARLMLHRHDNPTQEQAE